MTQSEPPNPLETAIDDFRAGLSFLTRIPARWIGATNDRPDFARAAGLFPLAGIVVGLAGGGVLAICLWLGTPPLIAAGLSVATAIAITGGLHEDGLADTLDGFGGATVDRKLEIMRDSRIGAYGAIGVVFSIFFRVAALASLAAAGPLAAAAVLIGAEALSRGALVRLWHALPPAQPSGLAHETGPPDRPAMLTALTLGGGAGFLLAWPAIGFGAAIVATLLSAAATAIFSWIADREIGGRTGDTLGACQQIAAIAYLIGAASAA